MAAAVAKWAPCLSHTEQQEGSTENAFSLQQSEASHSCPHVSPWQRCSSLFCPQSCTMQFSLSVWLQQCQVEALLNLLSQGLNMASP